jgi:hypothetical protein
VHFLRDPFSAARNRAGIGAAASWAVGSYLRIAEKTGLWRTRIGVALMASVA